MTKVACDLERHGMVPVQGRAGSLMRELATWTSEVLIQWSIAFTPWALETMEGRELKHLSTELLKPSYTCALSISQFPVKYLRTLKIPLKLANTSPFRHDCVVIHLKHVIWMQSVCETL